MGMKTTIDIPDDLYQTLSAASTAEGLSIGAYLLNAWKKKDAAPAETQATRGPAPVGLERVDGMIVMPDGSRRMVDLAAWWEGIPKAPPGEVEQVQRIIDEEFSKIDPRDWE